MIDDAMLDTLSANAKSAILSYEVPGSSLLTRRLAIMAVEARTIAEIVSEVRKLRGAIESGAASMRAAGKKCGVSFLEHGCDWPDAVAERMVHLREKGLEQEVIISRLRALTADRHDLTFSERMGFPHPSEGSKSNADS